MYYIIINKKVVVLYPFVLKTVCCNIYTDCMSLLLKLSLTVLFIFVYSLILIMNVYMMFTWIHQSAERAGPDQVSSSAPSCWGPPPHPLWWTGWTPRLCAAGHRQCSPPPGPFFSAGGHTSGPEWSWQHETPWSAGSSPETVNTKEAQWASVCSSVTDVCLRTWVTMTVCNEMKTLWRKKSFSGFWLQTESFQYRWKM